MSWWDNLDVGNVTKKVSDLAGQVSSLADFMQSDAGESPQDTMNNNGYYQQKQLQTVTPTQNVNGQVSDTVKATPFYQNPIYIFGGLAVLVGLIAVMKK